ncbi:hypothetical protein [Methylobacterium sp.]|jgi:hypothetical protein|uniref:hypothetical protein n=1 Tax=Methylobacterium sp. TaxID=409 RepID=UPI0025E9B6DC|nr:hypothetical protein [Methylobacterium sp.]MBY0258660.1 hypothetical protein [Methylobacterium sp.]
MVSQRHVLLALLCLGALVPGAAGAGERPVPPRLCPEDAPEGVRLPPRPDCGTGTRRPAAPSRGVHDLGGVQLRIGGRVSAEYGAGR